MIHGPQRRGRGLPCIVSVVVWHRKSQNARTQADSSARLHDFGCDRAAAPHQVSVWAAPIEVGQGNLKWSAGIVVVVVALVVVDVTVVVLPLALEIVVSRRLALRAQNECTALRALGAQYSETRGSDAIRQP